MPCDQLQLQFCLVTISWQSDMCHLLLLLLLCVCCSRAAQNLAQLQARFGRNCCSLLKIHSNPAAPPGAPPEMYRRARPPCLPGGGAGEPEQRPPEPPEGLGHGISADDLAAVGTVLREVRHPPCIPVLVTTTSGLCVVWPTHSQLPGCVWASAKQMVVESFQTSTPAHQPVLLCCWCTCGLSLCSFAPARCCPAWRSASRGSTSPSPPLARG
jgi:hypothetical protein